MCARQQHEESDLDAYSASTPLIAVTGRDRRHGWTRACATAGVGRAGAVCDRWRHGHAGRTAAGPGYAARTPAGERVGRPAAQTVRLALDRPGGHGRTRRRHRRRREQPLDLLRRATRPAASGRPSTTAPRGRRSSTSTRSPPSATSSWRRRTPTSSTSARASRTTVRARRSAPASTSPPTAGSKFEYVGLKETQTIAKVVVHPKDPNTVYVAAVGHLFGPNPERGVFKSTDGGKTWTNTKFIDNDTGFIDLVMHPTDPNTLFAASYQRRRQPWGFNGGGPGSGIWRTSDAGKTWTRLMGNGLPINPIIGRIGLNISRSKPTTIYAQLEVGPSGGTGAGVNDDGTLVPPGGRGGGGGGGGRGGEAPAPDPTKSGVWRSDDGGKSWKFMSNNNNRPMYYSKIRVDPSNPDIVYTTGASAYKSVDGGKTFNVMGGQSHSDHHALWINPRNGQHLIIGNDGGLDISYDQGDDVGRDQPLGARPVLRDQRRHAEALLRLRRPAGQRLVVRTERRAERRRHHERRLVSHRRRRRLLHGQRSARLDDRLLGVAGRRHQPLRPAHRADADRSGRRRRSRHRLRHRPTNPPEHRVAAPGRRRPPPAGPAERGRSGRSRSGRRARPRRGARQHRSSPAARARATASSGARRSCSRTTIRARSTSAAIGCSSRRRAATRGRRRPT